MWGDQEPPKDNWQAVCKPLDVGEPATAIDIGPGIIKGLRLVIAYYDNMLLISVATYFYHTLRDLKKNLEAMCPAVCMICGVAARACLAMCLNVSSSRHNCSCFLR